MFQKMASTTFVIVLMLSLFLSLLLLLQFTIQPAYSRCLCTVTKNGEYCGSELNKLNHANNCPKKMFFCADSNRDKEAVLLVDCPSGKECDIKSFCKFMFMFNNFQFILSTINSDYYN